MGKTRHFMSTLAMGLCVYYAAQVFCSRPEIESSAESFKREAAENPSKHMEEIEDMYNFTRKMKERSERLSELTLVPYKHLSLESTVFNSVETGVLKNIETGEEYFIFYLDGRTVVGDYGDRARSLGFETLKFGKEGIRQAYGTAKRLGKNVIGRLERIVD